MSSYGRETQSKGKEMKRAARALGSPAVSSKGLAMNSYAAALYGQVRHSNAAAKK